MEWNHPSWLPAVILPIGVLAAAVAGYGLQRWRLKRFGDSRVLGIRAGLIPQLLRFALLALGVSCAAAILAGPYRDARVDPAVDAMRIVLDFRPTVESGPENQRLWEDYCDGAASVEAMFPSGRFSVYAAGNPVRQLVPETSDAEGLSMVLGAAAPVGPADSGDRLQENLATLLSLKEERAFRVAVITSRTREDLARLDSALPLSGRPLLFVRIPPGRGAFEFGIANGRGGWSWGEASEVIRRLAGGKDRGGPWWRSLLERLTATQLLGLAGFLFLLMELSFPLASGQSRGWERHG